MSNDNFSLSNKNDNAMKQFIGQDGSEFVINTETGDAFISQRAAARVLEVDERTIRRFVEIQNYLPETAQIPTPNGFRTAALISSQFLYKIAEKYKPELADKMLSAGANLFIYGLAGYKVSLSKPKQLTATELILAQAPYVQLAVDCPGIGELAVKKNSVPCLFVSDIPFTVRLWVNVHFPSFQLSKKGCVRLGRELGSVYRQHQLKLPTNSYTSRQNKYTIKDHEFLCQVFETMYQAGLLT